MDQTDDPRLTDAEERLWRVFERCEGISAGLQDNCDLAEASRRFYRLARRRTMYGRFIERLLGSLLPGPATTPHVPPRPPPTPHERILDMSRLLRQTTTASDQSDSPFFRLPLEIRSLIYSHILPPGKRVWLRPSPHQITKSGSGGSLWIEHFPSSWATKDLTWVETGRSTYSSCCAAARTGFFGQVNAGNQQPDSDTLALMKTCQRMYLDLCGLCTFCFDDVKTLQEFSALYATMPIRHVQMVFYYCTHSNWYTWDDDQDPREVDAACRRLPELQTLLLSIHMKPLYLRLATQESIVTRHWLKAITAAPTVYVEVLGSGNAPRELAR
ncbi:hypothetical protein B0T16DRAFT_191016 [Cercophora newfieldiana]|uniref:DUF7730 domain-containing protein n=1 Tax=Cercophora newfieldiana TaxID=92897 RepID=A0AA39Y3N6_9PEZI|nr:hypothetical protein B0T16DRAFT_191016 [Cercophora newfieldiana]